MNTRTLLFWLSFALPAISIAQSVGIGTASPHASAQLDVSSTTRGLLAPRMTTAQRSAIASPAQGLMVYDTDTKSFWYHNGSAWTNLAGGGGSGWGLSGNAGTSPTANFVGTTDMQSLRFRVNNRLHGSLDTLGNVLLGDSAGGSLGNSSARNIAIGRGALLRNTAASGLIALGDSSMALSQTLGAGNNVRNVAIGNNTLKVNGGNFNTAIGDAALLSNTAGSRNSAVGHSSLVSNKGGDQNTAIGASSLLSNTNGDNNTALGYNAGAANNTGSGNVALGAFAMQSNTIGKDNVAIGKSALNENTTKSNLVAIGDSVLFNNGVSATKTFEATQNTGIGSKALFSNTIGNSNTAIGFESMTATTIGSHNTAVGSISMSSNTTGWANSSFGGAALRDNTTGEQNTSIGYASLIFSNSSYNTAVGAFSLNNNTSGYSNTAVGHGALRYNTTSSNLVAIGDSALLNNGLNATIFTHGTANTAVGSKTLMNNTTGFQNTAIGFNALMINTTGGSNTALGANSLKAATAGSDNTAIGRSALLNNTDGNQNTAVGSVALQSNTSGDFNTAIGLSALSNNTSGNNNTGLGYDADVSTGSLSNATAIGNGATVNASNKIRLGNGSVTVIEGQVNYTTSDGRFKKNIQDNVPGLDFIKALKPYTYQYKSYDMERHLNQQNPERQAKLKQDDYADAESMVHMGFIAQDVEKLVKEKGYNLSLVHAPTNPTDNYSIAYGELVVPLVKAMQEQQSTIQAQQKQIDELKRMVEQLMKK